MDYLKLVLVYLAVAVLGGYALVAIAAPEDEYRQGLQAYQRADMVQAMSLLKKSADSGYAPAQALYGTMLERTGNNDDAVEYYRKAADQGDANGQFALGMMFRNGTGAKKDPQQARDWIARAAEKGHGEAINVLAEAHMKADSVLLGATPEPAQVARWVGRAADNSYLPAIDYLARTYRTGAQGFTADATLAERYEARARELRGVPAKPGSKKKK